MQNQDWIDVELFENEPEVNDGKRKVRKERKRKWREIEAIKDNYRLMRELAEYNQYFC